MTQLLQGVGVRDFESLGMVEKRWILMPLENWPEKRGLVEPGLGRQVLRGARGVSLSGDSIGNGVQHGT